MSGRGWAALVAATCWLAPATGAPAATAKPTTATFAMASEWGTGYVGRYVLHNGGSTPISSWRLEFDLPPGVRLTSAWNALIARSDQHYVLTPVSYTTTIAPRRSITVGFEGTGLAPFAPPENCLFNGRPCDGSGAAATPPGAVAGPTTPTGLTASAVTANGATLSWKPSSAPLGVTSYDVYRGLTKVATVIWPTATITGLRPGTAYAFSVRAVDARANVSGASLPLTVETPTPAPALGGGLTASYSTVNDWGTGYVGAIVIRNRGANPVSGWRLALGLPAGTTLDTAWNAELGHFAGRVLLTPASWTKTIPTGGSVYVGFQGASEGTFAGPASCTVDGRPCTTTDSTPIASPPASVSRTASTRGSGSGATAPSFAPYVDMTLAPQLSLTGMLKASGARHASLAFVVSGGGCQATWGGSARLDDTFVTSSIAALRRAGGGAIVSFGGQAGRELAEACPTAGALAAQYQSVVDQYGIRDLDFDVEGAGEANVATLTRRAQAIKQLQATGKATNKPVRVSFTLPVTPTGLDSAGRRVLRNAIAGGVDIGMVNVMAMDFYGPKEEMTGHMGDLAISAAEGTYRQLRALYPRRSAAAVWRMVGVTVMLGVNDDPNEIFTTADAAKVTAFARDRRLGRLALWSANRDTPCPQRELNANNLCSGVSDPAWAFSKAFAAFARR